MIQLFIHSCSRLKKKSYNVLHHFVTKTETKQEGVTVTSRGRSSYPHET